MESLTVGAASEPSEEQALAALTAEAENAPTTTEEALAALKAEDSITEADVEEDDYVEPTLEEQADEEVPEEAEVTEEDVEEAEEGEEPEGEDEELTASEVVEYLTDRFAEQEGQLSDEDYAMAEDMGYDRSMVDAYIAGQQAQAELAELKIHEAAGGAEALNDMLVWAATGLSAKEIDAYNAALADNDLTKATEGIAKLRQHYEAANGVEPKQLLGGRPARASNDVFGSWAEVTRAMSDPRYGTKDATYTAAVAAKLSRSSL
jgi:hypothetical protein